jgi:hypothetical protein
MAAQAGCEDIGGSFGASGTDQQKADPMSILWLTMKSLRAVLTDSHFWVPLAVLAAGIALLLRLV